MFKRLCLMKLVHMGNYPNLPFVKLSKLVLNRSPKITNLEHKWVELRS